MLVNNKVQDKRHSDASGCSSQFRYAKIKHRRYFCLDQNPAVLAWVLFIRKETLSPGFKLESKEMLRWLRWLRWIYWWYRYNLNFFRTNFRILIGFIYYKLQLRNIEPDLELPFYGQLSMLVHKGYKIFDLRRGVVRKVFNQGVDSATIMNEIERMKNVSQIDFAPSISRWNIEERWYEEDYISGSLESGKPPDSKNLLKKFYKYIVPGNTTLILYRNPMTRNSVDYVNEIIEILDASRLSRQGIDSKNIRKISNFTHSIVERLQGYENCPCYLVFTHGDFCPENMLNTKHGLRIFDWESSEYRSALFDFYSYFFYRPVQHNLPVDKLVSEINEALPFFISKLDLKVPDIAKSLLSFEKVYRWLYYIERVSMLVNRDITDTNLNTMNYILRYIEAFNSYEEVLAGQLPEKDNIGNTCLNLNQRY